MKVAFALLVHDNPEQLERLVTALTASENCYVILHVDKGAGPDLCERIRETLSTINDRIFFVESIKCYWGDWSLVEAELMLYRFIEKKLDVDYVHFCSGSDFPIKTIDSFLKYLDENKGLEFIETINVTKTSWVVDGLQEERFKYYYWWKRPEKTFFSIAFKVQQLLRINRSFPNGLVPHMGGQFKTLSAPTIKAILNYVDNNPQVEKFFKYVWIPDESFIPTLVANLVPSDKISQSSLIFTHFNDYGRPTVFFDEHQEDLQKIPNKYFARKASPTTLKLYQPHSLSNRKEHKAGDATWLEFSKFDQRVLGEFKHHYMAMDTFYLDRFFVLISDEVPNRAELNMPPTIDYLGNPFLDGAISHWLNISGNSYEYLYNFFSLARRTPLIHLTYSQVKEFGTCFLGNPFMIPIFIKDSSADGDRNRLLCRLNLNRSGNLVNELNQFSEIENLI